MSGWLRGAWFFALGGLAVDIFVGAMNLTTMVTKISALIYSAILLLGVIVYMQDRRDK